MQNIGANKVPKSHPKCDRGRIFCGSSDWQGYRITPIWLNRFAIHLGDIHGIDVNMKWLREAIKVKDSPLLYGTQNDILNNGI